MPDINDPRLYSVQCDLEPVHKIHENKWFSVYDRGSFITTEYPNSAVMILPTVMQNSIVMVRPFRPIVADCPLELPSGGIELREKPLDAAQRELLEESGINIKEKHRFIPLKPISNAPNRNPRLLHVFQVDMTEDEFLNRGDFDHEIFKVECFSFKEIKELIVAGDVYIGAPLAIIGRYLISLET